MKKVVLFVCVSFVSLLFADTIVKKDGTVLQGMFTGGNMEEVYFLINGLTQKVSVSDISTLSFNDNNRTMQTGQSGTPAKESSNKPQVATEAVTLPVGTIVKVTTENNITGGGYATGATFFVSLTDNITQNNQIVVKKGTQVEVTVLESKRAGRLVGKSVLEITLSGFMINNKLVAITTDNLGLQGPGSAKGTIAKTGSAAMIGGAFGGGHGAAEGAAIGGALSLLTRGQQVNVPKGTSINFTLKAPAKIIPVQ